MNAIVFEARTGEDHLLHLPDDLPAGLRVRVTIEPLPEPESEPTPLGQELRAIRQRALDKGLQLQSVEAILDEVHQGRAEADDGQDLS
jgi:hypothetical protein